MSKTALVTGAGRGIGRAIAIRLAAEGYAVGLTARGEEELRQTAALISQTAGTAVVAAGDVTNDTDVQYVYKRIGEQLGPVHVLVNNAGYASRPMPFTDIDPDDWWRVVETNLKGPVLFSRVALPAMLATGRGYIVNINSLQGSKVSGASIAYGVSKAGLMRFTDALAAEVADSGVVVLDVSPGLVRTTMTQNRPDLDQLPAAAWSPPEKAAEKVAALVSGRYDALSGRFVHLTDDLDELLGRLDADARVLRMRPPA
jgi:NAD(P)-dependent dehydrogenase (short-subunit alcohol dehydrogenase family)